MKLVLLIGCGGFLGTIARYSVGLAFRGNSEFFPFGTLSVNIAGCLLIAIIAALSEKFSLMSPDTRLFLTTGFCGGFTTFSSLIFEASGLLQDGEIFWALLYLGASVIGGFTAFYLGSAFVKSLI